MKTDYENKAMQPGPLVVLHATAKGEQRLEFTTRDGRYIARRCHEMWGPGHLRETKIRGNHYLRWEAKR
jgi:hypothetical protein